MSFVDQAVDRGGRRQVVAPAGSGVTAEVGGRRIRARAEPVRAVRRGVAEDDQELAGQWVAPAGRDRERIGRVGIGLEEGPVVRLGIVTAAVGRHGADRGREDRAVADETGCQQDVRRVAGIAERHPRVVLEVDRGEACARDRALHGRADAAGVGLGLRDRNAHAARGIDGDDDVGSGGQAIERQGLVDIGGRAGVERDRHRARGQRVRRRHRDGGDQGEDGGREYRREPDAISCGMHRLNSP